MKKKTIKVEKPLVLDKETIIRLDDEQMRQDVGGAVDASISCYSWQCAEQEGFVTNSCLACSCVMTL